MPLWVRGIATICRPKMLLDIPGGSSRRFHIVHPNRTSRTSTANTRSLLISPWEVNNDISKCTDRFSASCGSLGYRGAI